MKNKRIIMGLTVLFALAAFSNFAINNSNETTGFKLEFQNLRAMANTETTVHTVCKQVSDRFCVWLNDNGQEDFRVRGTFNW